MKDLSDKNCFRLLCSALAILALALACQWIFK
jgi:hypothetical protein